MNDLITVKDINNLQQVEVTKELLQTNDFSESYLLLKRTIDQLKAVKESIDAKISDVIVPLNAEDGTTTISSDKLNFTYCAPTTQMSVDSGKLKKDFPEIYKACIKSIQKKGSLRVTERKVDSGEEND